MDLMHYIGNAIMPRPSPPPPIAVRRALRQLGADIRHARLRRRLPQEVVADRALTSRQTVARMEKGDWRVAIGTWASVLFALGLLDGLSGLASPETDPAGRALEREQLPQRARLPRSQDPDTGEGADG